MSTLAFGQNVDKLRASVGLESLAEELLESNMIWDLDQYKKDLPQIEKKFSEYHSSHIVTR